VYIEDFVYDTYSRDPEAHKVGVDIIDGFDIIRCISQCSWTATINVYIWFVTQLT